MKKFYKKKFCFRRPIFNYHKLKVHFKLGLNVIKYKNFRLFLYELKLIIKKTDLF